MFKFFTTVLALVAAVTAIPTPEDVEFRGPGGLEIGIADAGVSAPTGFNM
jgi:hypothetical protein